MYSEQSDVLSVSGSLKARIGIDPVGWELAPFVPLGPNATMPKRRALDHLEDLIYLRRCWVRQITPKGKGEKVHNLNLLCRIKVRFKSGRIIKRFRASVFFQREE